MGEKIDARDTGYIWCTAVVTMVVESINKEPILAIHYDDWNRWYDEFLPISSPRLARLGFYTSRDDIPKYKMKQVGTQQINGKNMMQAFIVNRVANTNTSKPTSAKDNADKSSKSNVQDL